MNTFGEAVRWMWKVGFFHIFLFSFLTALIYALLKRSKILGDSALINGTIALTLSFFLVGYPFIFGITDYLLRFSLFFAHASIFLLVIFVGFLIAGFFYPNLYEKLGEMFPRRTQIWVGIILGLIFLLSSNLISVLWEAWSLPTTGKAQTYGNTIVLLIGIFLFVVILTVASRREK